MTTPLLVPARRRGVVLIAGAALVLAVAACGKKGDPKLPPGVHDTIDFDRQYPSTEVPPPAADPEAE